MKTIMYDAKERGTANYGWLKANYSFSFANHYDPQRTNFGLLRVLNDDVIAPGMGFGMHPHDNMEIVTIPLKGVVKHRDSMGNEGTITAGEIQIMSAGKGITHSEFNGSATDELNLFQIWVFPKERNITPHYAQRAYPVTERNGKFQLVVSPGKEEGTLWINQDAWFSIGHFTAGETVSYSNRLKTNGSYIMVVEGEAEIDGKILGKRDAIGVWDTDSVEIKITKDTELLVLDVPMN